MIRNVQVKDAESIARIYNHYVLNSSITFETSPVSRNDIEQRIQDTTAAAYPYFVYERDGQVLACCYLNPWKGRCAYKTTAEVSVYVDKDHAGEGIGSLLMKELLSIVDRSRFHTLVAGIALPNPASVALHEKFGFKKISHFSEIGFKFGDWRDVGHWQIIFE